MFCTFLIELLEVSCIHNVLIVRHLSEIFWACLSTKIIFLGKFMHWKQGFLIKYSIGIMLDYHKSLGFEGCSLDVLFFVI